MNQLRVLLLASLLLLPASRVWADEFYAAVVCNDGQLDIDVAAAISPGFSRSWDIRGWTKVSPAKCEDIYRGLYFGGYSGSEIHLAFAFRDSTGVWGGRVVKPDGSGQAVTQSDIQICAVANDFRYRPSGDPASACTGESGAFLVPASFRWYPGPGATMEFHIGFDANDRAIPLGPGSGGPVASPSPASADNGPTVGDQFLNALSDAMKKARQQRAEELERQELEQSAPTPPPDASSPLPSDDPIGQGGFILPPSR